MKIISVSGQNLASLRKEFAIDFQKQVNASLFALVGDTGAGKSTILDAICLAIYKKVPRLPSTKKSASYTLDGGQTVRTLFGIENILSRGAKFGYAQVEFIGIGGRRFRARTSIQEKKKGFEAVHSLEVLDSCGQWTPEFEAGKNEGTAAVGLSWEQFRKVIILPQGEFRAFLSAETREKTEILEKLTNTQIYSAIDDYVRKRIGDSDQKVEKLREDEQKLAGELLTEEKLTWLRERQQEIGRQKEELRELSVRAASACRIFRELAECRSNALKARADLSSVLTEKEQAADDFSMVDLYRKTVSCRESFRDLENCKKDETDLRNREAGLNAKVTAGREKEQLAETRKNQAEEEFRHRQEEQENAGESLEKASELEDRLAALGGEIKEKNAQETAGEKKSAEAGKRLAGLAGDGDTLRRQLEELNARQEKNQGFNFLLDGGLERISGIARNIRTLLSQKAEMQKNRKSASLRLDSQRAAVEKSCGLMSGLCEKWQIPATPEGELFWKLCPEMLGAARSAAGEIRDHILALGAPVKTLAGGLADLSRCRGDIADKVLELAVYDGSSGDPLVRTGEQVRSLEWKLRELEVMLTLSRYAIDLRKGAPCPCCGATEHPRIDGLSPEELENMDSGLRADVAEKKADLEAAKIAMNKEENRKKELASSLKSLRNEEDRLSRNMSDQCSSLAAIRGALLRGLGVMADHQRILNDGAMPREIPCWSDPAENIARAADLLSFFTGSQDPRDLCGNQDAGGALTDLARLCGVISDGLSAAMENWNSQGDDARQYSALLEKVRESREDAGRLDTELKELDTRIKGLGEALQEQEAEIRCLELGSRDLLEQLTAASEGAFKKRAAELQKIRDELQNYGREKAELERKAGLNLQQFQLAQQEKSSRDGELQQCRQELRTLEEQRKEYTESHRNLFGGASSEQMRKKLQASVDKARDLAAQTGKEFLSAQKDREAAEKSLDELHARIQVAAARSDAAGKLHDEKASECLRDNPGLDREDLDRALRISEGSYHKARDTVDRITGEIAVCQEKNRDADSQLEKRTAELAAAVALLPPEAGDPVTGNVRDSFMAELKQKQELLDRDSNDTSHTLRTDLENREKLASCRKLIAESENGVSGFRRLEELFQKRGSLKNYAQSINFQCLLGHANSYIRSFTSGRYELFRVATRQNQNSDEKMSSSMEMLVTDHQSADESRSVTSLSGGEQFCVSLGLALGLSDLVTGNVTVGTMFVDEGFDTLDNSYLDNVLNCMQSAKINRQIGIISHVSAIVDGEMIPQKIRVERDPGNPAASIVKSGANNVRM